MLRAYLSVLATVFLTVYGQLVFKWRVDELGDLPEDGSGRLRYFWELALDFWVITTIVAVVLAAIAWTIAIGELDLSQAYPFIALTFVFVLFGSAIFFSEPITVWKLVGVTLIAAGLAVGSQG
jgi:multidrug transporter EmrE-like cation transporter